MAALAALAVKFGTAAQTSCGQIQAEVNHDGLPVDPNIAIYHNTLDTYQNNCATFATTYGPDFNDDTFVQYIFNRTNSTGAKKQVRALGYKPAHSIKYKGQARSSGGLPIISQDYNGKIFSFQDTIKNKNAMRALIQTFVTNFGAGAELYLFIDTGHNFIRALNTESNPGELVLNVINSQISLGDSCTTGKNIYNKLFYNNNLRSWWYQGNINVPPYGTPENLMFHTNLSCQMHDTGPGNWNDKNIQQIWTDPINPTAAIPIYNARVDNNITSITSAFKNASSNAEKSLCYQRKRSGDGLQIWFINHFATILLSPNGNTRFFATCFNGTEQHISISQINLPIPNPPKRESIRKKSFFVTIDWPAFCWAAYCHINVIFYTKGGDVIIFIANLTGHNVIS
jgi:hypothetical protein